MAKLPTSSVLVVLGLLAACSSAWAQDSRADACTPSCTEAATSIQACGEYNAECVCSAKVTIQVEECGKCVAEAGLKGADYDVLDDHRELCKNLGMVEDAPGTSTSVIASTPTMTTTSKNTTATAKFETASPTVTNASNAATVPSNGAAQTSNFRLGVLAVVIGLSLCGVQL